MAFLTSDLARKGEPSIEYGVIIRMMDSLTAPVFCLFLGKPVQISLVMQKVKSMSLPPLLRHDYRDNPNMLPNRAGL
jgi:hypothetical protein